jgi:hypothetical protein
VLIIAQKYQMSSLAKAFAAAFSGLHIIFCEESMPFYKKYTSAKNANSGIKLRPSRFKPASKEISGEASPVSMSTPDETEYDIFMSPTEINSPANSEDSKYMQPKVPTAGETSAAAPGTVSSLTSAVAGITSAATGALSSWWSGKAVQEKEPSVPASIPKETPVDPCLVVRGDEPVLYFCSCFVSTMPGYLYLTSTMLCLAARIPGISKIHEAYHLVDLQEIVVQSNKGTYSAMAYSCLIKLFKPGHPLRRELYVTPAVVDCFKLKLLIDETRDAMLALPPRL